jgi:hypothetical protein
MLFSGEGVYLRNTTMQNNTPRSGKRATSNNLVRFRSKFSALDTPEKSNRDVLRNALLCYFFFLRFLEPELRGSE